MWREPETAHDESAIAYLLKALWPTGPASFSSRRASARLPHREKYPWQSAEIWTKKTIKICKIRIV